MAYANKEVKGSLEATWKRHPEQSFAEPDKIRPDKGGALEGKRHRCYGALSAKPC